MTRRFIPSLLLAGLVLLALALAPGIAAAATPTYDQAIDKLVSDGYPQSVETYMNSLGANPLGMRLAGTASENAASQYLANQLKAMGMANVRLDGVPVDANELRGASVTVGGRTMTASQFPSVPGTPRAGISGDVVYVGTGTADEFAAAGDVRGKIVLIDLALDTFWLDVPAAEATLRGATAVIATNGAFSGDWYTIAPDALGSNDGEYMDSYVPLVYIATMNGDWLKQQLADQPAVAATVKSDVQTTPYTKGGMGYNVVAEIPGSARDGSKILITSHIDAHFRCGLDDTGAASTAMAMAKAMKMSGYKPQRTIVFMFTCAEEFGRNNAYFDYLTGSWYSITKTHTDWPGKAVGMVNLECLARPGALDVNTSPDLAPWLATTAAANKALLPWGTTMETPNSSWNDGWPMLASGVPSFTISAGGADFWTRYHTTYETQSLIDWAYVGKIAKFSKILATQLDGGLLPYDLKSRADDLAATVTPGDLQAAGVNAAKVTRLTTAVTAFRNAANNYQARKSSIPAKRCATVNASLALIEKDISANLTALSAWEETSYPHQQVLYDTTQLNKTLAALTGPQPNAKAALAALVEVGKTWDGIYFSPKVYADELARLDPSYPQVTWGGLGKLAPILNVLSQYRMIERGDYAQAKADLTPLRDADVVELGKRMDTTSALLENLAPRIDALR